MLLLDALPIFAQHTSYLVKPKHTVKLPVHGMKGEQLTSVWEVDLKQRQGEKLCDAVAVKDAVSVAMAPGEVNLCVAIDGYGDKPEPQ